MKVLVTGATGFVGHHLVADLVALGHDVLAVARDVNRLSEMPWRDDVQFLACDIHKDNTQDLLAFAPDVLAHVAWPGLPNYQKAFHFETTLPADYAFLKQAVDSGVQRILVTGSGTEFGLSSGALSEDTDTAPVSAYAIAKDSLRRFLQHLQRTQPFTLQWVRLFHMYGPGQSPLSLLSQLDKAIADGQAVFDMSGGEQLRDYLPVQEVARRLSFLIGRPDISGVIHCSSGIPVSVRNMVEKRVAFFDSDIRLNFGAYPYPDYESVAYWGKVGKLSPFQDPLA
jgi:dTDP-6-deoxy-L-talose 4-dehydrogenase (NAD+)